MADEFDRNIFTGLLQAGLQISLGAASKSMEMMRNPPDSVSKVVSGMMSMLTVPSHAGPGLPEKAQAMAGVWMEKGVTILSECQAAGEKLTKGK
jgi:hypothetical protein